ncbi:11089_t:CDS:2, partial [Acaulospora colombiana]
RADLERANSTSGELVEKKFSVQDLDLQKLAEMEESKGWRKRETQIGYASADEVSPTSETAPTNSTQYHYHYYDNDGSNTTRRRYTCEYELSERLTPPSKTKFPTSANRVLFHHQSDTALPKSIPPDPTETAHTEELGLVHGPNSHPTTDSITISTDPTECGFAAEQACWSELKGDGRVEKIDRETDNEASPQGRLVFARSPEKIRELVAAVQRDHLRGEAFSYLAYDNTIIAKLS